LDAQRLRHLWGHDKQERQSVEPIGLPEAFERTNKMRAQTDRVRSLVPSILTAAVILVGGVLSPQAASAATYYVATTGSDSNPCTQTSPCATIHKAGTLMSAGDTVYMRGGTYTRGIVESDLPTGVSWTSPTVAAYPAEIVTIKPSGGSRCITLETGNSISFVIFDRLICDGVNSVGGAYAEGVLFASTHTHIRFTGGEVKSTGMSGFLIEGSFIEVLNTSVHDGGLGAPNGYAYCVYNSAGSNNLYDHIQCYNYTGYGFHIYNSVAPYPNNNTVRNSVVHHNGSAAQSWAAGILIAKGDGNAAYNNVVYANGYGIGVNYGATNSKIYNNTVSGNTYYGMDIGDNSGASNTAIVNNILYQNAAGAILNAASGTTFASNLCNVSGTGCSVIADPRFVSVSAGDFHLQPTSPAIDKGTAITMVASDLDSVSRPQGGAYDIGPYEIQSVSASAPPAAPTNVRVIR